MVTSIIQPMKRSLDGQGQQTHQQRDGSYPHSITDAATAFGVRIPDEYVCPITMEVMKAPVQSIYGHNFEKDAIRIWLQDHSCCPLTRRPMSMRDLTSNKLLRADIGQWIFYNCLQMRISCLKKNDTTDEKNNRRSHYTDKEQLSTAHTNAYNHRQLPKFICIDK